MSETRAGSSGAVLRWRVHPLARDPRRGLLLAVAFALAWFAGGVALGPSGVLVAALATIVPMAHYVFANEYTLTDEGVSVRVVLPSGLKPWDRFTGYTVYPDGVLVAYDPYVLRNRINKGLFLYFDGNREAVVAFLERHLPGRGYHAPGASL